MSHVTYRGGYLSLPLKLVKTSMHGHTADLDDPISDTVLAAVNAVQATRWRINPFVSRVMWEAYERGMQMPGFPSFDDEPMPPDVAADVWSAMTPEERSDVKMARAEVHGRNAKAQGKRESLKRKLDMALELQSRPAIWFPHAVDFRGRIYPTPQDLNPQGDDVAKGLLQFADGKGPGETGLYWLKVAVANAAGQDKLTLDERVAWTDANVEEVRATARSPLAFGRKWLELDDRGEPVYDAPWVFLALAKDLDDVLTFGVDHPIHTPINIDATCSGIQHLSALGLDPAGARATNLMNTGKREDLYSEVAAHVKQAVADDAARGVAEAHAWVGNVSRSTVKRAVMTTPYGVTERGIRDQLVADGHTRHLDGRPYQNAEYLKNKIVDAMAATVVSARQIMGYFQGVARALAKEGLPLIWHNPAGMLIQQAYWNMAETRVRTLQGALSFSFWDSNKDLGLDVVKQAQSAAPNVIHSFDAGHLCLAVNAAYKEGIRHFSLVHDSYGCHAADIPLLQHCIKNTFISIYSTDRLERFEKDVRRYAPDVELPPRPEKGGFDITEVWDSPYFFS
jgi:DNA-directed RNA polymerase